MTERYELLPILMKLPNAEGRSPGPCASAREWLRNMKFETAEHAWVACENPDYLIWVIYAAWYVSSSRMLLDSPPTVDRVLQGLKRIVAIFDTGHVLRGYRVNPGEWIHTFAIFYSNRSLSSKISCSKIRELVAYKDVETLLIAIGKYYGVLKVAEAAR